MTEDRRFTLGLTVPPWPPIGYVYGGLELAEQLGLEVCSTWDHLVEFTTPSIEVAGGDTAQATGLRHVNLSFEPIDDAITASTVTDVVASIRRRLEEAA